MFSHNFFYIKYLSKQSGYFFDAKIWKKKYFALGYRPISKSITLIVNSYCYNLHISSSRFYWEDGSLKLIGAHKQKYFLQKEIFHGQE